MQGPGPCLSARRFENMKGGPCSFYSVVVAHTHAVPFKSRVRVKMTVEFVK